jgi:hypothetical protein
MTWTLIDDDQTPSWQVTTQEVIGFILLQTGSGEFLLQESGSPPTRIQLNDTSANSAWALINDNQTPNWTNVDTL